MPQTSAAKKALRVAARRRVVNDRWRKKVRDANRELREALTGTDKMQITSLFVKFQSVLDKAARHHIVHPNTVARRKSRLQRTIAKLK